jgi:hypothetical protein
MSCNLDHLASQDALSAGTNEQQDTATVSFQIAERQQLEPKITVSKQEI